MSSAYAAKSQDIKLSKEFSYELSKPYKVVDAKIKEYFTKDGEVLSVKIDGDKLFIQKFASGSLNQTSIKTFEDFEKGFVCEEIIEFSDKYYFFYSIWDKEKKNEQLFVREINFEKGDFIGVGKKIITVKSKIQGQKGSKFIFQKSFNKKILSIRYKLNPEEKNDDINKSKYGFHVYDIDLKENWSNLISMPYTESKMKEIELAISNDYKIYMIAKILNENEKEFYNKEGAPNFKTNILTFYNDQTEIKSSEIDLHGKKIIQISFFEGKNDELIIAGFYGKTVFKGNLSGFYLVPTTDGLFVYNLNKDGKISNEIMHEIPSEILKQYLSERQQKKADKKEEEGDDLGLEYINLKNIKLNNDGSIILIGEKDYFKVNNQNGNNSISFFYEEILISKINNKGELEWMKKLPKKQIAPNASSAPIVSGRSAKSLLLASVAGFYDEDYMNSMKKYVGGLSYKLIESNENYYLIYLDNIKNINLSINEVPKVHQDGKGGFLTGYKISKNSGEVSKLAILDTRDAKGLELEQFKTSRIIQISNDFFVTECYKNDKEDIMVKIKLNE